MSNIKLLEKTELELAIHKVMSSAINGLNKKSAELIKILDDNVDSMLSMDDSTIGQIKEITASMFGGTIISSGVFFSVAGTLTPNAAQITATLKALGLGLGMKGGIVVLGLIATLGAGKFMSYLKGRYAKKQKELARHCKMIIGELELLNNAIDSLSGHDKTYIEGDMLGFYENKVKDFNVAIAEVSGGYHDADVVDGVPWETCRLRWLKTRLLIEDQITAGNELLPGDRYINGLSPDQCIVHLNELFGSVFVERALEDYPSINAAVCKLNAAEFRARIVFYSRNGLTETYK
jgi:hypothetical protein